MPITNQEYEGGEQVISQILKGRVKQIKRGTTKLIPHEVVMDSVRKNLRKRRENKQGR